MMECLDAQRDSHANTVSGPALAASLPIAQRVPSLPVRAPTSQQELSAAVSMLQGSVKPLDVEKFHQAIHALVTTPNKEWLNSLVTTEEAVALVTWALEGELLKENKVDIPKLIQEMGCHPLGLKQACGYIRENQPLTIVDFLSRLESQSGAFVGETWKLHSEALPKSVAALWEMTFEKLEDSPARVLLDQLAYVAPEAVPETLISTLVKEEEAVETLARYGLIQGFDGEYTIHRLLQRVLVSKHSSSVYLQAAIRGLKAAYQRDPINQVARVTNRRLLPHAQALIAHCDATRSEEKPFVKSVSTVFNVTGHLYEEEASYHLAKECYERALAITEKVYGPDHPNVAVRLTNLGNTLRALGDAKGAKERFERALAITEKAYSPDHPNVAADLNNLGAALQVLGDAKGAKKRFERALVITEKVYGPDHPDVATVLSNLGAALQALGDAKGAKERLERALAITEKVYGPDHPGVAAVLSNLGAALQALGDAKGAKERFERALAITEKVYGPDHPDVATVLNNLGNALRVLRDAKGAKERFERAVAIAEKVYGPDHPDVAVRLNNLGNALQALGDVEGAKGRFERALTIAERVYGPDHPEVGISLNNLGNALQALGDVEGAKGRFERAYSMALKDPSMGSNHPDTQLYKRNLDIVSKSCVIM